MMWIIVLLVVCPKCVVTLQQAWEIIRVFRIILYRIVETIKRNLTFESIQIKRFHPPEPLLRTP